MHVLHYFMYSCFVSQLLDESSNLKAGCKKDVIHDAFDAIYVSYIHNRSAILSFHLRPVMVDIVHSLPPEPAVFCTQPCTNGGGYSSIARHRNMAGYKYGKWSLLVV